MQPNLLFLCEGNADSSGGSFSGISKSLVDHMRAAGHGVVTADVDLYGFARAVAAISAYSPKRRRWTVRFRLLGLGRLLRSARARKALERHGQGADVVLQIGATFGLGADVSVPYFLYCDSNIRMAERGASTGMSWAAFLTQSELRSVISEESRIYHGAAGIFTMSEYLRRCFITDFGLSPDKVVTAGGGPNFDLSVVPPRRLRGASQPPTVLFVGAQFARKGGDVLLEAFKRVREVIPAARLQIVGPPARTDCGPGVEWLGYLSKDSPKGRDDLVRAFVESDVFCLPTRYEPFGVSFLEAMSFGLPCIGTDDWAVPELVRNGETGFTVPVNDPVALADRIARLLSDRVASERMGAAGRRLAVEHFTWERTVARMLSAMSRLAPEAVQGSGRAYSARTT